MPPIVSIVGRSKVGKTTMLEKLIPAMLKRGYRVGVIKHDFHDHFEIDQEGKDTWRHRQAGAQTVAISSPSRLALTKRVDRELGLAAITDAYFQDENLVFTEGYKSAKQPKIEICRRELQTEPLCTLEDRLVAVVSDFSISMDVPRFELDDLAGIADFIEERFLSGSAGPNFVLRLDGRKLPMKAFVKEFVMGGILGMISTLRGYKDPTQVDISIRLKKS